MAKKNRRAFTLVEMLVVIVIISMLVALLVPAVIGARERARRASCANNQAQVAKAILQYETSKQHLPGYVNQIGKSGTSGLGLSLGNVSNLSWVVVILEQLGHADLWKEWRVKTGSKPEVTLPELICSSDTEKRSETGALSMAVNCGISDFVMKNPLSLDAKEYIGFTTDMDMYEENAYGLFFAHDSNVMGSSNRATIALDGIADGAQQTIMLSENIDATRWAAGTGPGGTILQKDVGILWWSGQQPTFPWLGSPATYPHPAMLVNSDLQDTPVPGDGSGGTNTRVAARPSSYHPGGVNVIYADGHGDFMSERVEYDVYRDQMISSQTKVRSMNLVP